MSGYLLDTSVLVTTDEAGSLELPEAAAISVVTLGELHAGVLLARDDRVAVRRRRRLTAIRAAFSPLVVDEPVAEQYGRVLSLARSERRTVKATDALIVATAAATDRDLLTLDLSQAGLARAAGVAVRSL